MTVKILVNTVGRDTYLQAGATAEDGYDARDLICGPRNKLWRSIPTADNKGSQYATNSNQTPDHLVIARADFMLTEQGQRLRAYRVNSSTFISGIDENPFSSSDLIGIKSQDYAISFSASATTVWGVLVSQIAGAEALQFSKMYFSAGFNFARHITPRATSWANVPASEKSYAFPLEGDLPYEVEARAQLQWSGVLTSEIDSFLALPTIFEWPIFIYDPSTYLWPWKLEHVIIEGYTLQHVNYDIWNVQLSIARLKHYD